MTECSGDIIEYINFGKFSLYNFIFFVILIITKKEYSWHIPGKVYGITRDPSTLNYVIVLQEVAQGSLRSNLMIKKYNPNDKYYNLYYVAKSLLALHKCNLVHGDLHSGRIVISLILD